MLIFASEISYFLFPPTFVRTVGGFLKEFFERFTYKVARRCVIRRLYDRLRDNSSLLGVTLLITVLKAYYLQESPKAQHVSNVAKKLSVCIFVIAFAMEQHCATVIRGIGVTAARQDLALKEEFRLLYLLPS